MHMPQSIRIIRLGFACLALASVLSSASRILSEVVGSVNPTSSPSLDHLLSQLPLDIGHTHSVALEAQLNTSSSKSKSNSNSNSNASTSVNDLFLDHNNGNRKQRSTNGQLQHSSLGYQPKLVQWAKEPVHYFEGSTLVLTCSLAIAQATNLAPLKFQWLKQGRLLSANSIANRLTIDTLQGDYSFLRLTDLRASDSGAYTCLVSNVAGAEDRTTTQVIVQVKLHWLPGTNELSTIDASELHNNKINKNNTTHLANGNQLALARAGDQVSFECGATSQPRPKIRWFKLIQQHEHQHKHQHQYQNQHEYQHQNQHQHQHQQHQQQHQHQQQQQQQQTQQSSLLLAHGSRQGATSSVSLSILGSDELALRTLLSQLNPDQPLPGDMLAIELPSNSISNSNALVGLNTKDDQFLSRWRVESSMLSSSEPLDARSRLFSDKLEPGQAGIYACEAINANSHYNQLDASVGPDRLRRLFGLVVNVDHVYRSTK